jgi:hypothetical protein
MKSVTITRIQTLKDQIVMVSYEGETRGCKYSVSPVLKDLIEFTGWDDLNIPAKVDDLGSSVVIQVDFDQDFPGRSEYLVAQIMKE